MEKVYYFTDSLLTVSNIVEQSHVGSKSFTSCVHMVASKFNNALTNPKFTFKGDAKENPRVNISILHLPIAEQFCR